MIKKIILFIILGCQCCWSVDSMTETINAMNFLEKNLILPSTIMYMPLTINKNKFKNKIFSLEFDLDFDLNNDYLLKNKKDYQQFMRYILEQTIIKEPKDFIDGFFLMANNLFKLSKKKYLWSNLLPVNPLEYDTQYKKIVHHKDSVAANIYCSIKDFHTYGLIADHCDMDKFLLKLDDFNLREQMKIINKFYYIMDLTKKVYELFDYKFFFNIIYKLRHINANDFYNKLDIILDRRKINLFKFYNAIIQLLKDNNIDVNNFKKFNFNEGFYITDNEFNQYFHQLKEPLQNIQKQYNLSKINGLKAMVFRKFLQDNQLSLSMILQDYIAMELPEVLSKISNLKYEIKTHNEKLRSKINDLKNNLHFYHYNYNHNKNHLNSILFYEKQLQENLPFYKFRNYDLSMIFEKFIQNISCHFEYFCFKSLEKESYEFEEKGIIVTYDGNFNLKENSSSFFNFMDYLLKSFTSPLYLFMKFKDYKYNVYTKLLYEDAVQKINYYPNEFLNHYFTILEAIGTKTIAIHHNQFQQLILNYDIFYIILQFLKPSYYILKFNNTKQYK